MNKYSLMEIILLLSTLLFAGLNLWMLLKRVKEKKILVKALEANLASFNAQFSDEEIQLKQTLGEELSTQLESKIQDLVSAEKQAYKKLSTVFIDHQAAAIELLPLTMNKVIVAYIACITEIVNLLKQPVVADTVVLQDNNEEEDISQTEALIEQLRIEKQAYSDKYKSALQLAQQIYLKYKEKLELEESDANFTTKDVKELAVIFKLEDNKE